jgi:hypothetical protein
MPRWNRRSWPRRVHGQQRIFFIGGVVANHVDLAVSWRGHEGNDPALLEEAQDTLAGPLDDGLE